MNDKTRKHPALKPGQAYRGPDYYGCCNSGIAPKIVNSKTLKQWSSLNKKGFRFVVGPDVYTHDATLAYLYGKVKGSQYKDGRRVVRFFKTAAPAWKYFFSLADAVIEANRQDAEQVKTLRVKANAGDLGAALSLGDYGVL